MQMALIFYETAPPLSMRVGHTHTAFSMDTIS